MDQPEIIETTLFFLKQQKAISYYNLYHDHFDTVGVRNSQFATCIRELVKENFVDYTGNYEDSNDIVLTRFGKEMLEKHNIYSQYIKSKELLYDRIIKWGKDNPIVVAILIIFLAIGGIATFTGNLTAFFHPKPIQINLDSNNSKNDSTKKNALTTKPIPNSTTTQPTVVVSPSKQTTGNYGVLIYENTISCSQELSESGSVKKELSDFLCRTFYFHGVNTEYKSMVIIGGFSTMQEANLFVKKNYEKIHTKLSNMYLRGTIECESVDINATTKSSIIGSSIDPRKLAPCKGYPRG
jgi:hypothetical protein